MFWLLLESSIHKHTILITYILSWPKLSKDLAELVSVMSVKYLKGVINIEDSDIGYFVMNRNVVVHMIVLRDKRGSLPWRHPLKREQRFEAVLADESRRLFGNNSEYWAFWFSPKRFNEIYFFMKRSRLSGRGAIASASTWNWLHFAAVAKYQRAFCIRQRLNTSVSGCIALNVVDVQIEPWFQLPCRNNTIWAFKTWWLLL